MRPDTYTPTAWGSPLKTPTGYWANIPAPLPPQLELNWRLVEWVAEAERTLSEVAGAARLLPDPLLLIRPMTRQEAVLSSRIEGTQASLSDILVHETVPGGEASATSAEDRADIREVANYVTAFEHGSRRLREFPLSLRLIRELHAILMEGTRGHHLTPGEFRRSQNWIGSAGSNPETARYVPPPPAEMAEGLDALEKFLHAPSPLPLLVRTALVHVQFEAIHPFLDGNGRIGRLLIPLMLTHGNHPGGPLLFISPYIEARRTEYYERLLAVTMFGDWMGWLEYFLKGVALQARDTLARIEALRALREAWLARAAEGRASAFIPRIIDMLFERPVLTVGRLTAALGITHRAAKQNIDKLAAWGLIARLPQYSRPMVFMAHAIMALIEGELPNTNAKTANPNATTAEANTTIDPAPGGLADALWKE